VAADGKVFLMDCDGRVGAVDARRARQVWRTCTNPATTSATGRLRRRRRLFGRQALRLVRLPEGAAAGRQDRRASAGGPRTGESIHGAPTVGRRPGLRRRAGQHPPDFDAATGAPSWTYQALSNRPASWRPPARRSPATPSSRPSARASWWRCGPTTATTCGTRR
jgi:outer membrane protein assembly factor BamB